MKIAALAFGCVAVLMLIPNAASAKPKVALTAIEGDASGDVHDAVAEALEGKDVSLISSREVNRAVDKIGDPAEFTEKELKKLSTQLSADAVVLGSLEKSGGSKSLKFRIFVHKKMAKGFTINFKDPKSKKLHKLLHDKIVEKIGAAGGDDSSGDEEAVAAKKASDDEAPAEEEPPSKKAKKGKKAKKAAEEEAAPADDEVATKKTKKAKKAAEDEEVAASTKKKASEEDAPAEDERPAKKSEDDGGTEEDPLPKKKKVASSEEGGGDEDGVSASGTVDTAAAHSAATPGVRVDLGISVLKHSYTFNKTAADVGPKDTSLSAVPGVRLDGEIYPFNLSGNAKGALANIGFGGDFDRTISLKLNTASNGMTYSSKVKQMNYSFGLRYRLAFGKPENPMVLTFGVGYGKRLFSPDKSTLTDAAAKDVVSRNTPTTEYTLLDPGAAFRLPVAAKIAINVGLRGLIITNGGPIQATSSYGQAKVYGVEAQGGVDIQITKMILASVVANFDQIGFSFQGKGVLSKNADGAQIVGGLADRGIGGAALVGIIY